MLSTVKKKLEMIKCWNVKVKLYNELNDLLKKISKKMCGFNSMGNI